MTVERGQEELELKTLELVYKDVCDERDRLRDARAAVTRQLGPLPVAAGISTGTIVVFAHHGRHTWPLWAALALLFVLVFVSVAYSYVPAYRQIRLSKDRLAKEREAKEREESERREAPAAERHSLDRAPAAEWYKAMIALERDVYGVGSEHNRFGWPCWNGEQTSLQDAFDRERTGLYAVQLLFACVVVLLGISQLI